MLQRPILLLGALLFGFVQLASAQILSVSCTPTTGPTQAGVAYSASCTASGGIAPYSWAISAGALPTGLTLTPSADTTSATVSGTPSTAGPYSYTVQVTDSTPVTPMTAPQSYSGTIAPNITGISPTTVAAGGPDLTLTVNGAGFGADSVVSFNSTALATTVVSSTQVTATVPASLTTTAGTAQITLTSASATSNGVPFTVTPTISSLSPNSATAGGPGFTLTVNGTGFESGATVDFNGNSLGATIVSPTQLTASVPASLIATPGTLPVTVTSGGQTSNSVNFTVAAAPPPPAITSISPTSATAGGAAFTLTVNGSNFGADSVVNFNGTALTTTFVSAAQVTAAVPASLITTSGTVPVTLTTSGMTSNSVSFTILPAPVITSITPATVTAGGAAFTLTVNGSGFASGTVVEWNGASLSTTFLSANELTASVPASDIASAGSVQITVKSGGVRSNAKTLTIVAAPALTSLDPTTITAGSPAFTLTVNGTGFASGAVVNWNGTALATSFVNATQLTAPVLANLIATTGTAHITVTSGGVTSNSLNFSIVAGPALTSLSPATTSAGSAAFTLTVNGTGFASGAVVEWNTTALTTHFVSATELTASVPANLIASAGTVSVTVKSAGVTSNAVSFPVVAGPTLSAISPVAITAGSGAGLGPVGTCPASVSPIGTLTLNGTGFVSGATAQWNGQALVTTLVSATQLTACVPSSFVQAYGTPAITVVSHGTTSNALQISLAVPAISITGLQSTSAPTQQLQVGIQLASATPTALAGTLKLSFSTTAPGVPAGYVDPALQFSSGGTALNFTIPAGSKSISAGAIQQGTVEGTITVTMTSLTANGSSVLPSTPIAPTVSIPPLPPVITAGSVQITNLTSTGFDVVLTGYSVTRDMTTANFSFTAAAGTQFTGATTFAVDVTSAFSGWYGSASSQPEGSLFMLTVPFTISGPDTVLGSVSVTLTNSVGASAAVSASP